MPRTSNTADAVDNRVHHLLADCVMASSIVVGRVLLAANQKLGVKELAVVARPDLVDWGGVQVDED